MKYWETEHHMPLPWPEVVSGYWWRYPNPSSSHVFSVDTLDTRLEGDKLYARRLIMKTNSDFHDKQLSNCLDVTK